MRSIAILLLLYCGTGLSSELMPIGSLSYDNVQKANIKLGGAYFYDGRRKIFDEHGNQVNSINDPVVFGELSAGERTTGLTIGWGSMFFEGNYRVGGSYIETESDVLCGVQASVTGFFINFRFGIYESNRNSEPQFLFGIGAGW